MEAVQEMFQYSQLCKEVLSDEDYCKLEVESYNSMDGEKSDLYDCPVCRNKKFVAFISPVYHDFTLKECDCVKTRKILANIRKSGFDKELQSKTFDSYITNEPWQKNIKNLALEFLKSNGSWFYAGGQSGSGKTHICTAICNYMLGQGKAVYYIFGGKDESSYQLIQGITLSGVFFDEVALMPRSFVEQAVTRTISVENSKLWFNCNPDSSQHWFYKEWILQAEKRQALHLHFTMHDNPTLSETQINYAETQFSGVFYDRYIKGLWVLAEGLVYENWKDEFILDEYAPTAEAEYFISCDYGTVNPCSMGLWALEYDKAVRISEYYHNGRTDRRRTDEEHYQALEKLADGRYINSVIVDPSAASFIECIRKHGKFKVRPAKNSVISGIRATATLISKKKIFVCRNCKDILKEFSLYRWDETSQEDKVIKENDHAMDDMRYFVNNVLAPKMLRNIYRNGGENND